jgi:hypothetical protein
MKSHAYKKRMGWGPSFPADPASTSEPPDSPLPPPASGSLESPQSLHSQISSEPLPAASPEPSASGSCRHIDARGHQCRMPALSVFGQGLAADDSGNDSGLCAHHAQRLARSKPSGQALAAELLDSTGDFTTAASVNLFLGNLVKQLALQRISRPDAIALAYLSQLLLNSLSAMDREQSSRDEELRDEKAKRPVRIVWDMPAPPYERDNPPEDT